MAEKICGDFENNEDLKKPEFPEGNGWLDELWETNEKFREAVAKATGNDIIEIKGIWNNGNNW